MSIKRLPIGLLILVIFTLISCDMAELSDKEYLAKGIQAYEEDKFNEARIEIKNAIQANTENSDAHYYLALIDEKKRNYKAMKQSLIEAVKLNPDNLKAQLKLARTYLIFNQIDKSLKSIERIQLIDAENLEAKLVNAAILIRQKNNEEAFKILDEVLAVNSDNLEAVSLKVILLNSQEKYETSLEHLETALKTHPDKISLHLLRIQVHAKLNNLTALIQDYETLIQIQPESKEIKSMLAKVYMKAKSPQKAEKILRGLVDEDSNDLKPKIELLNFLYSQDEKNALLELDQFYLAYQDKFDRQIDLVNWLIRKKQTDIARDKLYKLLDNASLLKPQRNKVTLLLAQLDVSDGDSVSGLMLIDEILEQDTENVDAQYLKAEILASDGNIQVARELLELILLQNPKMDKAISLLGMLYESEGNNDKAKLYYKDALKFNPRNLRALEFMVDKEIQEEHYDYAIELLENSLRYLPTQIGILTRIVEINIIIDQWEKALEYIVRIKKTPKGKHVAEYLSARLYFKKQDFQKSEEIYKSLLQKAPWIDDAMFGLAEVSLAMNKTDSMLDYLDQFIQINPSVSIAYVIKSQLYSQKGQSNNAELTLKQALKRQNVDKLVIYRELARVYNKRGKKELEKKAYLAGLNENPRDIRLLLLLADYYEKNQDYAHAIVQYRNVLKINPTVDVAKNNLATLLVDFIGTAESINEALQLTQVFKQSLNAYFLDTYGWVLLNKFESENALSVFKRVILLEPDEPIFHYHLAKAFHQLKDNMSAINALRQAQYLSKDRDFKEKKEIVELMSKLK